MSMRVLVRPIGLDMVEVGGSSPPRPAKIKNPRHAGALIASGQHARSVTPRSCLWAAAPTSSLLWD